MDRMMEVESGKESRSDGFHVQLHPLAIVHMSDQYTRISSGGSPLDKNAPVVGLLFGLQNSFSSLQVRDADDIPVEISDASKLQVDLHKAVFPQHNVVGWYRVSNVAIDDPTSYDLTITRTLKEYYAPNDPFCYCLLHVPKAWKEDTMRMECSGSNSLKRELPINLFELHQVENNFILLGSSNWELHTSESERIAVERVMKERPTEIDDGNPSQNSYILETKEMQISLSSMKDRIEVLVSVLEDMQNGKIPVDPIVLRQIQTLVTSLGPLTVKANDGDSEDVQILSHLAFVAKTICSLQSYTDKFRVMQENRTVSEMRRGF